VAITWEQIEARKRRLERLSRGLMKEAVIVDEHDDPFLRVERLAYLQALRDAIAGLETARVVLANDVHITQSEELYTALWRRGVETVFVRYPRKGHGATEPRRQLDQLERTVAWFDRFLRPGRR
jgi:hypothetical protein